MKKLSLLCALLLAFTLTSLAQTGGGSGSSSGSGSGAAAQSGSGSMGNNGQTGTASPGTPSTSDQSGSMSQPSDKDSSMKHGKKADMKGCISQSGSNYMLMDKKHPDGVQISSSQDLSAHVGHKVEVKGTWADANSGSGSGSSMSSASSGGSSASSGGMKAINVTDIKMISDHCDDANNSNTKKDSDKK